MRFETILTSQFERALEEGRDVQGAEERLRGVLKRIGVGWRAEAFSRTGFVQMPSGQSPHSRPDSSL
ncbi:MAG: hypothetical protein IAE78_25985 [Myxococcus sp.]|nr:hypothetical protein [Myxococcus sp.]